MLYYLAFVWNARDPQAAEEARALHRRAHQNLTGWSTAIDTEGMSVLIRADEAHLDEVYRLPNAQGVVLGRLFESAYVAASESDQGAPGRVAMTERSAEQILRNRCRGLLEHYWGRYVAFLRDVHDNTTFVVRDPSGAIPCQGVAIGRVRAYFVRLEDLERINGMSRTINTHYLLGYLVHDSVCVRETGLRGIETVLAGECVEHADSQRRKTFIWNPLQVTTTHVEDDFDAAVTRLRRVVRNCVHAWSSCFDGILLELSGGLDSSIVLSCLADAPTRPRLLSRHNFSASGDLDERSYARLAAKRAGCRLIEQEMNPHFELPPRGMARKCLSPFPQLLDSEAGKLDMEIMRRELLDAQFSGDGGDELFFRGGAIPTSCDFAWRHPLSPRLLSVVAGDCAYSRVSFWRVLRLALRLGTLRRPWSLRNRPADDRLPLLRPDVKQEAMRDKELWHPLFQSTAQIEPGKYAHAYLLTFGAARGYVPAHFEYSFPSIAPLLSQPLMELSLRTPTYVLMADGRDRAAARQAFAGDIPQEIHRRRSKGLGGAFMREVLAQHVGEARELLLDGFLVRAGLVDREKLEDVLSGGPTRVQVHMVELATYLDIEMWAQGWEWRDARVAA